MQQPNIYHPYRDHHSVDPLRPIFYIIQHIPSGKYYAGYKSNRKSFMTEGGYCTSSKVVNNIVNNEGLDIFRIIRIRYFISAKEAHSYEVRFLNRIRAMHNEKFYNQTNGHKEYRNKGGYKLSMSTEALNARRRTAASRIGEKLSLETKMKISAALCGKHQSHKTVLKRVSKTTGQKRTIDQLQRLTGLKRSDQGKANIKMGIMKSDTHLRARKSWESRKRNIEMTKLFAFMIIS